MDVLEPTDLGERVGYFCLWGIPTTAADPRPRGVGYPKTIPWPWDSPQKATDQTPYTVLLADIISKGTDNYVTPSGDVTKNVTDVPHTPSGFRVSANGQLVEPEVLGSEGGNVGLVDGSVSWRKQILMHQRFVEFGGSPVHFNQDYIGYW